MDCDSTNRLSEQRAEVGSITGEQGAASEANGGSKDRPVFFRKREGGGKGRIDRMTGGDMQMPKFGIQRSRTIRQLQGQVPPRFLHHIGICPALVPRPPERCEQKTDRAV
jgi:hypothetical protein